MENTHAHKKISEEHLAASKESKPPYETPVVMPLGGLTIGIGQACASGPLAPGNCNHPGSTAGGTHCNDGPSAFGTRCRLGSDAANDCGTGPMADGGCVQGEGVSGS